MHEFFLELRNGLRYILLINGTVVITAVAMLVGSCYQWALLGTSLVLLLLFTLSWWGASKMIQYQSSSKRGQLFTIDRAAVVLPNHTSRSTHKSVTVGSTLESRTNAENPNRRDESNDWFEEDLTPSE